MFFSPHNTHSSIQGETWTNYQNWVSKNWIQWDSKRDSDTVENTNSEVGNSELRKLGGDPKLRELGGDPELR